MTTEGKNTTVQSRFVWARECRWIMWGLATVASALWSWQGYTTVSNTPEPLIPPFSANLVLLAGGLFTVISATMLLNGWRWRTKGWTAKQALVQHNQNESRRQWDAARTLYRALGSGAALSAQPPGPVVLRPDEQVHVNTFVGYTRHVAAGNGSYTHMFAAGTGAVGVGLAVGSMIGNSRRRSAAAAAATPMWREHQQTQVLATNYGLIGFVYGQVMYFDWSRVSAFYPEPHRWRVIFEFHGAEPLMLHGPAAPLIAVYATYHLRPRQQFLTGYELAALR